MTNSGRKSGRSAGEARSAADHAETKKGGKRAKKGGKQAQRISSFIPAVPKSSLYDSMTTSHNISSLFSLYVTMAHLLVELRAHVTPRPAAPAP